jgi:hypothetical protein
MTAYSFKLRFVDPIRAGLGLLPGIPKVHHGESFGPGMRSVVEYVPNPNPPAPKRQTIRAVGLRRHARPGETLQLYHGMRTRQCFKIGEARCVEVAPILIHVDAEDPWLGVQVGDNAGTLADDEFARADGFGSVEDMWLFWRQEHPGVRDFKGMLIRWEPL